MSWWDDLTGSINKGLDSKAFKAVFPVQAIAQGLTQGATKLAGIGGKQGLTPANQYALGAAGGSGLAGGAALFGGAGAGAGAGSGIPTAGVGGVMQGAAPAAGAASPFTAGVGGVTNASGGTGLAGMGGTAAPAATPAWQQALQNMRTSGGQQQQAPQQQNALAQIYKMFPNLKPSFSGISSPSVMPGGM